MLKSLSLLARSFLLAIGFLFPLWAAPSSPGAEVPPNFILFITDDISQEDLGCYGSRYADTPNLDRMAAEGRRFDNAYLTISSCSPSRCSIITGRYPHNTGAAELHTELPHGLFVFPAALKTAGYYTALSGKHHMGDAVNHGFDLVSKGKGPGKEEDWVDILRERPVDRPFFFWFASSDAHRPWSIDANAPVYDPEKAPVPPYLYDGPITRQDLAEYFHEVSRTDHFLGELRKELRRQEIEGDTYVIYMADNGRPFPRCKTRVYDSGVKTPFIVACPGRIRPGMTESLISSIDIAPTILELAGLEKPASVQGVSFRSILEDPGATTRDYVFAEHNWHVNQAHERMVRLGEWVYIRNAWPHLQSMCGEASPQFPAGEELWKMEADGKLKPEQRDIFLVPRFEDELYRVTKDPHQLVNLAGKPEHAPVLEELRAALDRWAEETGDTVPEDPTNDREDAYGNENPNHKRGTMPGTETNAITVNRSGPIRE